MLSIFLLQLYNSPVIMCFFPKDPEVYLVLLWRHNIGDKMSISFSPATGVKRWWCPVISPHPLRDTGSAMSGMNQNRRRTGSLTPRGRSAGGERQPLNHHGRYSACGSHSHASTLLTFCIIGSYLLSSQTGNTYDCGTGPWPQLTLPC